MRPPGKPTLNPTGLKGHYENEIESFLDAIFCRTESLLEEQKIGTISRELIVFETLLSAFSGFEDGLDHEAIKPAYPLENWRDETVTIPKAWVELLLEGWVRYKNAPVGTTFGEAFNLEGGGQGKQRAKATLEKISRDVRISNLVIVEYLAQSASDARISWDEAIARVAHQQDVSHSTVKKASEKYRRRTLSRADTRGWLSK